MTSQNHNERYRREQAEFVSNNGGSSSREVIIAILPNICGILLTSSTLSLFFSTNTNKNVRTIVEFCLNVVPCVLCCTILSDRATTVCLTMMTLSMLNIFFIVRRGDKGSSTIIDVQSSSRRPFLTNFRALTNIITAVCVLAVDFKIFPRKFAKTEVYGYSLMDTGVGLFVVANALVAPETRDLYDREKSSMILNLGKNLKNSVRSCGPLLILGLGRFAAVEYFGYQKNVTEYGIHWNFFVTLAFVKIATSFIAIAVNSKYSLMAGILILAIHEYVLTTKGLKNWILGDTPRNDFVSANREGIVSVAGYVGLYFVGVAVGRLINSTYRNVERQQRSRIKGQRKIAKFKLFGRIVEFEYNESMILCVKLSLIAVQACAATLFCDYYFRVSRRLTNSGYCAWIITLSCTVLTLLLLVEVNTDIIVQTITGNVRPTLVDTKETKNSGSKKKNFGCKNDREKQICGTTNLRTPEIFEAVNYNGLAFFLLANVITGIVNMSVRTLYVERNSAIQILIGYIFICHVFVVILYRYKLKIKL